MCPVNDSATSPSTEAGSPPVGSHQDAPYSPSHLAHDARMHIEQRFNAVWLNGELSNFRRPSSGHWYFSVKDAEAQIRCAMFVNRNRAARLQPQDGLQVLLRGRVSLYEPRGDFQIIVDHMEPAGAGALRLAYDALLQTLHREGLTDPELKAELPALPQRIAVITSGSGAALRDMLAVWQRRFPLVEIVLLDVAVQGPGAEPDVLNALQRLPLVEPDVVIVSRGGGSLEDLWTFNTESVARAIAQCPYPIVSAIGHEIDTTIADYVADVRAPTPTAAAELCTPDRAGILRALQAEQRHLVSLAGQHLNERREAVAALSARLTSPAARVERWMQRTDDLQRRLDLALQHRLRGLGTAIERHRTALRLNSPALTLAARRQTVAALDTRMRHRTHAKLQANAATLGRTAAKLDALSPVQTVARGYSIATDNDRNAITELSRLPDEAELHLSDGYAKIAVTERHPGEGLVRLGSSENEQESP